ncbi:related to methionyl-trna formyltransferase [Ustilago trichophora]|uniref:methionyl-tRNA formyltransferase n=2 Tax=Ustilago trichophora TaxID=86804 RepID=A0A5C3EIV6_9BASI|nr:related to methionyl-trna formyltransferase [Ustilago trichophora]
MTLLFKPRLMQSSALRLIHPDLRATRAFSTASTRSVPTTAPYDILFCGTDTFAATSLSALISSRSNLTSSLHVLTPPDVAQKWGAARMKISPVKQLALSHSLPHSDVPSTGMQHYTLPETLPMGERSILLTCSFGHLIPDMLLDRFPNPWQRINIHPSLLPQLRGAAPIQWALARSLTRSGVSIQTLEKGKFDTGKIVAQESFNFPPIDGGFLKVEQVMAARAAKLLVEMLSDFPRYWENSWEQIEDDRTFAPKLKAQHSVIRWDKMSAENVVARERGFGYLYPLSTTLCPPSQTSSASSFKPVAVNFSNTSTLPLIQVSQIDSTAISTLTQPTLPTGSALYSYPLDALLIRTHSHDTLLAVKTVKVAGKKSKTATDFYKAYRDRADPRTGLLMFQ